MALTYVVNHTDVIGSKNARYIKATFTGVTGGEIKTGLNTVLDVIVRNATTTNDTGLAYLNYSDTGSTAKGGSVYLDGINASDVVYIIAIGN